jgi:hypothetical protein
VAVRFAIANEDHTVLDFQDSRIGDSDSEDVGSKILQACFAGAYGLGVDVPIDLPEIRRDLIEETGLFHFIAELGFEDLGESSDGEIEIDPGGVPDATGGGEGATGDDVMDMGVKLQGTTPGVEDPEESREISSDIVFIHGEFFDGLRGSLEQGRVSRLLVFTNESAQTLGDGKREQEMMTGELPLDLFLEPLLGLMMLTGRAMTISTGAIDPMELPTLLALVKGNAVDLGATGDDGIDDFAVSFRHELGIALQILGAEGSEDLIDWGHGPTPP